MGRRIKTHSPRLRSRLLGVRLCPGMRRVCKLLLQMRLSCCGTAVKERFLSKMAGCRFAAVPFRRGDPLHICLCKRAFLLAVRLFFAKKLLSWLRNEKGVNAVRGQTGRKCHTIAADGEAAFAVHVAGDHNDDRPVGVFKGGAVGRHVPFYFYKFCAGLNKMREMFH